MPINHKFLNANWNNGFYSNSAILHNNDYDPEVLIIGTFNHGWPWNPANFFYGRNYFWSVFENYSNNNPGGIVQPPLIRIFELCTIFKMSFADVVKGTSNHTGTFANPANESVTITSPNLLAPYEWNSYSDQHLNHLGYHGCLEDNVIAIEEYLFKHKSIKHIYFTWKLTRSWLSDLANNIANGPCSTGRTFGSVLSPSGNGFGPLIAGYNSKLKSIQHAWLWVNNPGAAIPYFRGGYTHFDHNWIGNCGVLPGLF